MTDEVTTVPATEAGDIPATVVAPGPGTTAAPAPDPSPEGGPEQQPERTYTQAELDAIIGKRLARERRSLERELAARQPVPEPAPHGDISIEQFESPEAYAKALAAREADLLVARREAETEQRRVMDAHADREESAREKFADYDTVVQNPSLAISPAMASVIVQSDAGPEIAYHLGQHPDEALRISRLSPMLQARELGRLEAKLASEPPTRKTSSAPAPITPIRSPAAKPAVVDTTDPRSTETMTTEEWIAAENKRELARLEARYH